MKNNNELNFNGKIDYSKESLGIITRANIEHWYQEKKTEHAILAETDCRSGGFEVSFYPDYIAINVFRTDGYIYSVSSYMDHKDAKVIPFSGFKGIQQIRIYKNRKVSFIRREMGENDNIVKYYINNTNKIIDASTASEIKSDKEIENRAVSFSTGLLKMFNEWISGYNEIDPNRPVFSYSYSYNCFQRFKEKTQEQIENFFDFQGNKELLNLYASAASKRWYGHKDSIPTMEDLTSYLSLSPEKEEKKKNKSEQIQDVANIFENVCSNSLYWTRKNNLIIAYKKRNSYNYHPCIFIYNVDKKTRTFALKEGDNWEIKIPSLQILSTHLSHGYSEDSTSIIYGDISMKDLFKGTNVAWILDNVSDIELKVCDEHIIPEDYFYIYPDSKFQVAPIKTLFKGNNIPLIALSILATTGDLKCELLLKAKLFNLYLAIIGADKNAFCDLDDKKAHEYTAKNCVLTYHSKGKNLQDMFKMSLNFLRVLDGAAYLKEEHQLNGESHWSKKSESIHYIRVVPRLNRMAEVIDLTKIDKSLFEKLVKSIVDRLDYGYNLSWGDVKEVGELTEKSSPKELVEISLNYSKSNLCVYRDYLRSRKSLKNFQNIKLEQYFAAGINDPLRLSQIKEIFSKKQYPEKVEKAKRFFNIIGISVNARNFYRAGCRLIENKYIVEDWDYSFHNIEERKDYEIVSDEKGKVVGVVANLQPMENLIYLHNLAAKWVNLFSNEQNTILFEGASKRVEPLEWEDKELGLKIVAPQTLDNLNKEGSILSHCVASYATSIIEGRENIMFLRRIDMPNDPFYTVEILPDGEIRQVHCYRNGSLTATAQVDAYKNSGYEVYNKIFDIVKFLKRWATTMNGRVNANTIKESYGALCALRY